MRQVLCFALILVAVADVQARTRRSYPVNRVYNQPQPASFQPGFQPVSVTDAQGAQEALDEVNATRAQRGLPPYIRDHNLTVGAMGAAVARARLKLAGHTSNDFGYLPVGTSASAAGCAAWEPSWGWGSCATYDRYTYAGAAWAFGSDGRRYMHLFVR